jgi:hypothetical protein
LIDLPEWPPNHTVGSYDKTMTEERKKTLMDAGTAVGMKSGSKVVDVAANPKAVTAAIKADPATLKVAEKAIKEVETQKAIEGLAAKGIDVNMPPATVTSVGMDLQVEAMRIAQRLRYYRSDVKQLMKRAEPDQYAMLLDVLAPEYHFMGMLLASYGEMPAVPDDLAALEV